jgi:hypothetical protein
MGGRKLDQIEAAKARNVGQPGENRTWNRYEGLLRDGSCLRRGEGEPYAVQPAGPLQPYCE